MPMSAAERQRKYREKLKNENPDKYQRMKDKNLEKTKQKYRKISELSAVEQKLRREKWRNLKQPNKVQKHIEKTTKIQTERKLRRYLKKKNIELTNTIHLLVVKTKSQQKRIIRLNKKVNKLMNTVETLEKATEKDKNTQLTQIEEEKKKTPGTKTEEILKESFASVATPEKQLAKKILFENVVLKESLTQQYDQAASNSQRNTLKGVVNNDIIKKYKMTTKLGETLGLKGRLRIRVKMNQYKLKRLAELKAFFERDDNTRATAGKKEYKTLNKTKEQVRYLLDTMKNLHKKYKKEGGKLSYATFTRYKPFYVINPRLADRDTCACIKHSNLNFVASKLKQLGLIKTINLSELVSTISCNINDQKCMYQDCDGCSKKRFEFNASLRKATDIVSWYRWTTKTFQYLKHGSRNEQTEEKSTKRTVKEEITGSLQTLQQTFIDQLRLIKKHFFNMNHQSRMYRDCKENLSENEIALHCDFSENYICKLSEEVQSMHFGASKRQVSLHTGVIYAKSKDGPRTLSFCTIAQSNNHGPGAIWAHLTPVLNFIKEKFPAAQTIHFYSDGPTTQYRQKNNFHMINTKIIEFGFERATWSYFEASHGKGAADGIGGATKRTLDRHVTYGEDIPDAEAVFNCLTKEETSKINYFYIPDESIDELTKYLDSEAKKLIPVPNTMAIHQVMTTFNPDIIKYRKLSCFCQPHFGFCKCYELKEHNLKQKPVKERASIKKKTSKLYRDVDMSSSSDTTGYSIIFAESDDSYCTFPGFISTDSSHHLDEQGFKEKAGELKIHVEQELDEKTGIFKSKELKMQVDQELDEETGYLKSVIPPNKKINILSTVIVDPDALRRKLKLENKKRKSIKKEVDEKKTVTTLSDIQNRPENTAYSNLNQCKLFQKSFSKLGKENYCLYDDPIASTSKDIVSDSNKKKYTNRTSDEEARNDLTSNDETQYGDAKIKRKKVQNTDTEYDSSDCSDDVNAQLPKNYKINDSVIVRYYQRKAWKYYIGFITETEKDDGVLSYNIEFLKTVSKPELKFTVMKKKDVDIVPALSIVKAVNLTKRQGNTKDYYLRDDCDAVYF